ncbi:zinc-dependent metalloprotease [Alteromonas sp.]|uniref:zinc-dependent metalloprotease n=1 Tax=Alteromonas sp. TaxID=232 RepID=UPI000B74CBFE|nr:zinc-dependent metalloprotease [Alteromonas sp.]MAI38032.1 peptidase [Alteromonas sp.]OUX86814.1 MAG: peptidase [Alteromonas sp. TMED35]|tara:strand:- start:2247 stop:4706 length:2460 start_codon:yes stop_codon:yes gene_type:complete
MQRSTLIGRYTQYLRATSHFITVLFALFITSSSLALAAVPSISEFTDGMKKKNGLIPMYYDDSADKVFLAVPASDEQYLFQSSLPYGVGSNDIGLDRGQLGRTRLISFERFGNKLLLTQHNTKFRAGHGSVAEKQSIDEAFADSVIAGFAIVAKSDSANLVDYTDYLLSDVHGIGNRMSRSKQGSYKVDKMRSGVYLPRTKGFEKNTELEALVTFSGSKPGGYVQQVTPDAESLSVHLHHSFVALPEAGYTPRVYHPYSGYWKFNYYDYSTAITESTEQRFITRHRLEKKTPHAAMSEAVEPITYYLDPGIPEPVMSSLKEGASWWNQAFEAAGFKDAFQVKVLPEGADPMDVRYNVINWVHRATRGWSYGSSVVDPRTGEIIKGHVTLGSLRVRQDYLIALGLTSPFSDGSVSNTADTSAQQEMALDRIKQLSAHEVGHTLGIAHNFAASENNRASVMDYPHPQITLKDGVISLENAYDKGIGDWDKHAVTYGYATFASEDEEKEALAKVITKARNAGLAFKSDSDTRSSRHGSANGHMWENGSDPLDAFDEISKVRDVALNNLGMNTLAPNASLSSLEDSLVPIFLLHRYQLEAVAKQVGGLHYEYERKGDYVTPQGQQFVAPSVQQRAMQQLIKASTADYLSMPESVLSLIPPTAYGDDITREQFKGKMGLMLDPASAAASAANFSLSLLLHPERLNRLQWQVTSSKDRRKKVDVNLLIKQILNVHWYKNKDTSAIAKRLQLVALNAIMEAVTNDKLAPEVKLAADEALLEFNEWLEDEADDDKYEILNGYFDAYFASGTWPAAFDVMPLPPGSPI